MTFTVFDSHRRIAAGSVADIAAAMQAAQANGGQPLAFDDTTGRVVDLDLRGTPAEVAARYEEPPKRGRPKLGVKAREVTLLPRHWDWLSTQRGGASAALRRLVEEAMRADGPDPRRAQEAAYRAATALAGNLPLYEDAVRALFAGNLDAMADTIADWPEDIRDYVLKLARTPQP
ncbi:DUF2239 family protein [Pseudoruegeria sp. HB172150]|uniref:DUF2239 family protein n=1 Tax=Pseudoruegeria sp. HB172150 TaxID=2721164 RepID=UPI0015559D9F|nr:DUF2239 family protein [Pseudoruegeria sp. HB172150]